MADSFIVAGDECNRRGMAAAWRQFRRQAAAVPSLQQTIVEGGGGCCASNSMPAEGAEFCTVMNQNDEKRF